MPRCACASEVYGSVFVCLSVCLCRLLQLLKDQRSASKGFYGLLVMDFNSWICKIMLRSRVMARFAYLECHCSLFRTVQSETCPCSVATLLSSQLCTKTLAIGSCKSEKRAAKLHLAAVRSSSHYRRARPFVDLELFQQRSRPILAGKLLSLAEQVSYCKLRLASCGIASVPPPRHQHPCTAKSEVGISHQIWCDCVVSVGTPHLVGMPHQFVKWERHTCLGGRTTL